MDFVEQLDTGTLAFVSGIGSLLMAAAMTGSYWAGMRSRALIDWALAGVCLMVGYLAGYVLLTQSTDLPAWLSATIANFVIGLGHVFILTGTRRYLGRRPWTVVLIALTLLLFSGTVFLEPVHTSPALRIMMVSTLYLSLDAAAGILFWRASSPGLAFFHRITATVLIGYAMFVAVRMVIALAMPSFTASLSQDAMQILAFLLGLGFIFTLTLAFTLVMFRGKEVELQRLVHHDPLTGLLNRRSLLAQASREMARCERYRTPLSLVVLDIDRFKQINDRQGHAAGDDVIRSVAACIAERIRGTDSAFRLGGEEFLVLMPSTDIDAAALGAERLREAISLLPTMSAAVSCSFGVTQVVPGRENWDAAMRRADRALYLAKHGGRDRVVALPAAEADVGAAGPPVGLAHLP